MNQSIPLIILAVVASSFLTACDPKPPTYTVADLTADPKLALKVTHYCLALAKAEKNPFKDKSCQAVVLYEETQCKASGNYMEADQCANPLYLLTRAAGPNFAPGAL